MTDAEAKRLMEREKYGEPVRPRLRAGAYDEVKALAKEERRSINRQVEVLVDEALQARRERA